MTAPPPQPLSGLPKPALHKPGGLPPPRLESMAQQDGKGLDYEEYEEASLAIIWMLTCPLSYEALPPNFSVAENCFAGAFAGVAVRKP